MRKINQLKMIFDSRSVNESFSRMAVASFCSQLDMTLDELGDIKTVVSEAVTNCIVHAYPGIPMTVGNGVTVGHGAILHSCVIGDNSLIGMGAILLNGSVIGRDCIVAAGALVPQNVVIPDGSLVMGNPAKIRRQLTEEEIAANRTSAEFYIQEASEYKEYFEK